MAKYERDVIINKLNRLGLKPLYDKQSNKLYGFECSTKQNVGIKTWGYLDFLKVRLFKK